MLGLISWLIFILLPMKTMAFAGYWEPLNVGIIKSTSIVLPPFIMKGIVDAIENLNKIISVKILPYDTGASEQELMSCINTKPFSEKYLMVEEFLPTYSIHKVKQSSLLQRIELFRSYEGFANFFLFIKPLCGNLIICQSNGGWKRFKSTYDLFRHEILHALGFGTITSANPNDFGQTQIKEWKYANPLMPSDYLPTFHMDFAKRALNDIRSHFNCMNALGVEADDHMKTHLSEYVFGNELMTPFLSNGYNYFSLISAHILEDTFLGQVAWYKIDETIVGFEDRLYWYGRGWGCDFIEKSCFEYIQNQENPLPFCDEMALQAHLKGKLAQRICFSNGTDQLEVKVQCNFERIFVHPTNWLTRPVTLESQFPALENVLNTIGYEVYGSAGLHRYCPFVKEILYDKVPLVPFGAIIVPCGPAPTSSSFNT